MEMFISILIIILFPKEGFSGTDKLESIEFCKDYYEYGSIEDNRDVTFSSDTVYAKGKDGKWISVFNEIKLKDKDEIREQYAMPGYPDKQDKIYGPPLKLDVDQKYRLTTMKFQARKNSCPKEIKEWSQ